MVLNKVVKGDLPINPIKIRNIHVTSYFTSYIYV